MSDAGNWHSTPATANDAPSSRPPSTSDTSQPADRTAAAGIFQPVAQQEWLDEQQQGTWRAWLAVTELLPRTLDAQLQRDAGLTHAAYVVLAMLSEAPVRSRRMSDLARTANQSQSRLSHTVARLEERGWVRRERAAEDRRGNVAVLTDEGWDIVQRVAPGHAAAVREGLFGALTPEQTEALGDALRAVLERLDPDETLRVPPAG